LAALDTILTDVRPRNTKRRAFTTHSGRARLNMTPRLVELTAMGTK